MGKQFLLRLAEELAESLEQPVPLFSDDSITGDARQGQSFLISSWPVKDKQRSCFGLGWSSEYACGKMKGYIQQQEDKFLCCNLLAFFNRKLPASNIYFDFPHSLVDIMLKCSGISFNRILQK